MNGGVEEPPDFRERYELPDGLYRQNVPAFDEVREGSGFDKIFEVLLSQGRTAPELIKAHDCVLITVRVASSSPRSSISSERRKC